MKLKERDRSEVYDRLVRLADRILAKHNVCGSCPVGCASQKNTRAWCCNGCPKLGPNGCTVQALACKLWLCTSESFSLPYKVYGRLMRIRAIAVHYKLYVGRANKEESLHYGSLGVHWCPGAGG